MQWVKIGCIGSVYGFFVKKDVFGENRGGDPIYYI